MPDTLPLPQLITMSCVGGVTSADSTRQRYCGVQCSPPPKKAVHQKKSGLAKALSNGKVLSSQKSALPKTMQCILLIFLYTSLRSVLSSECSPLRELLSAKCSPKSSLLLLEKCSALGALPSKSVLFKVLSLCFTRGEYQTPPWAALQGLPRAHDACKRASYDSSPQAQISAQCVNFMFFPSIF